MKQISVSQLYNFINNDTLIDYLDLQNLNVRHVIPDLDIKFIYMAKKMLSNNLFFKYLFDNINNTSYTQYPSNVLQSIKTNTKIIQNSILNSIKYKAKIDFILHKDIIKHFGISSSTRYSFVIVKQGQLSKYNIFSLYIGYLAFKNLIHEDISIYIASLDNNIYSLSEFNFDDKIIHDFNDSIEWIETLEYNSYDWNITNNCPLSIHLLPNMSNKNTKYDALKSELAHKYGELTLICHIGNKTRELLHQQGIYTYKDQAFKTWLYNSDLPDISKYIYESLMSSTPKRSTIIPSISFNETIICFDIESFSGTWDNGNPAGDVFIGILICNQGQTPYMKYIFNEDALIAKQEFESFLKSYENCPKLLHYTEADLTVVPEDYKKYCVDVHPLVRDKYEKDLSFRDFKLTNFGLKHITTQIFGDLYIDCKIKNGLECSSALYNYVKEKNDPRLRYELMNMVKEYNKIDVLALAYLYGEF